MVVISKMLPKLSSLLAIPALLAATVVAAPALEVPAALVPRDACPTTSRWLSYSYSTTWRATTTVTNGWSSLGSVTSTKTEEETRTINTRTTVFSPATTTLPGEPYPALRLALFPVPGKHRPCSCPLTPCPQPPP